MPNLPEQSKGFEADDNIQHTPEFREWRTKPEADAKAHIAEERNSLQKDKEKAIKIQLELVRPERMVALKKHLIKDWEDLKDKTQIERVRFIEAFNLPPRLRKSYEFLNDDRLAGIMIGVVPDDMWTKGSQHSESSAENDLIKVRESYFDGNDETSWMTHELGHCLQYKNKPKTYRKDSSVFAFDDLKSEYTYPNNKVEVTAFSRQFEHLKSQGRTRAEILGMLRGDYSEKDDFPFFNRLMDKIF